MYLPWPCLHHLSLEPSAVMPTRFRKGLKERIGPSARLRQHGDVPRGDAYMRKVERGFKGRDIPSVEGGHESIERGQGFHLFILGIDQRASEQQASQTQNQGKYPARPPDGVVDRCFLVIVSVLPTPSCPGLKGRERR